MLLSTDVFIFFTNKKPCIIFLKLILVKRIITFIEEKRKQIEDEPSE